MTDWMVLPGFPLAVGGDRMPTGSRVKIVKGAPAQKNGKTVIVSGREAFVQALELKRDPTATRPSKISTPITAAVAR